MGIQVDFGGGRREREREGGREGGRESECVKDRGRESVFNPFHK